MTATSNRRKRIVVTGGRGFIGNELVRQISALHDVCIFDNQSRIAPHSDDIDQVTSVIVDVTDARSVKEAFEAVRPEIVLHLAAIHFIPECNADPECTLGVNVSGTSALLRHAETAGVKHFVFVSSGAVYADSADSLGEDARIGPVDIYGWSKWFGEDLCRWHSARAIMPITVARLFNTYGPRETNAHILPEIISQLKAGDTLSLGNIQPRRDYIFVSDVAKALFLLADRVSPDFLSIVNLCSGYHASVAELIEIISDLLDRKITVLCDQARFRKADKNIQVGKNEELVRLTGWKPEVDLRRGLRKLLLFEGLLN